MIELRWVFHDMSKGGPPMGSICINAQARLYQKLQYRQYKAVARDGEIYAEWTDWQDVQTVTE
jgi:hypothetical protein